MADIVDEANDLAAKHLSDALRKQRSNVSVIRQPPGGCLWCNSAIPNRRWCDAACRDDWERAQRA